MKTALYRKYRPARFADIVGQDAAGAALRNQIKSGRLGHAYIFTGIRGTGKTTFARLLAKAANCLAPEDGEPCGLCEICTGIDDGSLLDVTEIDAASNSGVDNVRMLREETAYCPAVCNMRVYIIDEVHMLTREAFNALLKIMEEPPPHVLFILATTESHRVPATILSRCQRFDLKRISAPDIKARLLFIAAAESIELTEDGAAAIARLADGALRDALSLLDTCASMGERVDEALVLRMAGVADRSYLFALAEEIERGDLPALFGRLAGLYAQSIDPARLCLELVRHYRNLLMAKVMGEAGLKDGTDEEVRRYSQQAEALSRERILNAMGELAATADRLSSAPDRMLALELCFARLCAGEQSQLLAKKTNAAGVKHPSSPRAGGAPLFTKEGTGKGPVGDDAHVVPQDLRQTTPSDIPAIKHPSTPRTGDATLFTKEGTGKGHVGDDAHAVPQDLRQTESLRPLGEWNDIVASFKGTNGMLYGFLANSKAYVNETHVLIDAGEFFLKHMRENERARDAIKAAISEITGLRLPIGPYTAQSISHSQDETQISPQETHDDLEDLLSRAREGGVEIEIVEN